jgi:signal transduction histidine kinase
MSHVILDWMVPSMLVVCWASTDFFLHRRLKRKRLALQAAFDAATSAAATKDEFMAVMSHELRTPLTGIMGFTELLLDEIAGKITTEQRDMLERADACCRHLLTLIEQVLDLSKAQHQKLWAKYERVEIQRTLSNILLTSNSMARTKQLAFYVNFPQSPIDADTDPIKLRQILFNVVGNAIKFTAKGSVTVELRHTDSLITILVRDTGPGIPKEFQERVFEPFWQADGSFNRSHEGTGLGLAIAQELVHVLNGHIKLCSNPGTGTEVEISLPRYNGVGWPYNQSWELIKELPPPENIRALTVVA